MPLVLSLSPTPGPRREATWRTQSPASSPTTKSWRRSLQITASASLLNRSNPVSLNQESAIWTYRQALTIVEEVGDDHVGICVDLWNLWQDCEFVNDLSVSSERMFLLQVSDWRTPRSSMDRRSVGTGDIPIGELLHAVYDAGYRGPCVLEIFSHDVPDSLYDTDLHDVLAANRSALNRAWQTRRT